MAARAIKHAKNIEEVEGGVRRGGQAAREAARLEAEHQSSYRGADPAAAAQHWDDALRRGVCVRGFGMGRATAAETRRRGRARTRTRTRTRTRRRRRATLSASKW